jgi:hypothetical protein
MRLWAAVVADRVAVAGWQWDRWIERVTAVRMVLVRDCEDDY